MREFGVRGASMTVVTELIVTVVGGIVTALILERFRGGAASATVDTAPRQSQQVRRGPSLFGQLVRIMLAVAGGYLVMKFGGKVLIREMEVLPRGMPSRLGLLVAGTMVCWMFLSLFGGRR